MRGWGDSHLKYQLALQTPASGNFGGGGGGQSRAAQQPVTAQSWRTASARVSERMNEARALLRCSGSGGAVLENLRAAAISSKETPALKVRSKYWVDVQLLGF